MAAAVGRFRLVPVPWWKSAAVYQIYPRSFCDRSGDGIGDLAGITAHLDHIAGLGVGAIWLSPIYPSPMADFGYDVSDYCDVHPLFGSLADLDELVAQSHARGLKVMLDWVPNHTSSEHPWFIESRSSRRSPKRDWYVWRDGDPSKPPNNWKAAFGGDAWTWDDATRQWYLHLFLPEQPDLDWHNPEVVAAMHATLRFWLDRGIDGFRIDVVHAIGKDLRLPDVESDFDHPMSGLQEPESAHEIIRGLRRLLDSYPGDRAMVGEVWLLDTSRVARYYGRNDELHLAFNFPPMFGPWDAAVWRAHIEEAIGDLHTIGAWPTWVLSNHDNPRHRSRYGGSEGRARAAAVLLVCLRGTPFVYAGEELGLEDAIIPPDRVVDPGGRDGCRAPIPWDGTPSHGWAGGPDPWLPWPPDADRRNAAALAADPASILHLYRRLLAARRASPALSTGDFAWLDSPPGTLAWLRSAGDDRRAVIVNFTEGRHDVRLDGAWTVEVASDGQGEAVRWTGKLGADQAVVLRPAGTATVSR
jgi:alpha-glucosidase